MVTLFIAFFVPENMGSDNSTEESLNKDGEAQEEIQIESVREIIKILLDLIKNK